jgi:hypothetical protein
MLDLGLDTAQTFVAFDFWANRALGTFKGSLTLAPVAEDEVQVVCLRERESRPQLLSTNRHFSCGAADLEGVLWRDGSLSGELRSRAGEVVVLAVTEPPGWEAVSVESPDARAQLGERLEPGGANGIRWRRVVLAAQSPTLRWTIRYRHTP